MGLGFEVFGLQVCETCGFGVRVQDFLGKSLVEHVWI